MSSLPPSTLNQSSVLTINVSIRAIVKKNHNKYKIKIKKVQILLPLSRSLSSPKESSLSLSLYVRHAYYGGFDFYCSTIIIEYYYYFRKSYRREKETFTRSVFFSFLQLLLKMIKHKIKTSNKIKKQNFLCVKEPAAMMQRLQHSPYTLGTRGLYPVGSKNRDIQNDRFGPF